MSDLPFIKYQGIGNDFVIIDHSTYNNEKYCDDWMTQNLAALICNRNYGVGADGVLIIGPGKDGLYECSMWYVFDVTDNIVSLLIISYTN